MKRIVGLIVIACALSQAGVLIEPQLAEWMAVASASEQIPVLIALKAQACPAGRNTRTEAVDRLKDYAAASQSGLLSELQAAGATEIEPLWIVNAVACRLTRAAILQLAGRSDIWFIQRARIPVADPFGVESRRAAPDQLLDRGWHIAKIGADSVWNLLGIRGESITVGLIDTGVNYNHLDLASHLWNDPNYPHHGWNFEQNSDDPIDTQSHGTFMAGLVASDGTAGETCGVAPRARIMACRVAVTVDTISENEMFSAVQFCLAPPLSPAHGAHLILMPLSWMYLWNPRRALWRQTLASLSAAGLLTFCPGRGGSTPPDDIGTPADCPPPWLHPANQPGGLSGALCVAGVDADDIRASFSGTGPVTWQTIAPFNDYPYNPGPGLIKPDVCAPAVNLNSTAYNNNSGYMPGWSGNSLAVSIAAGVAALMLARNPNLTPVQLDSILENTVKPLGTPPKNNTYGTGRVSAYQAVIGTPAGVQEPNRPLAPSSGVSCAPNPTSAGTTVNYSLSVAGPVELALYDLSGRLTRILFSGREVAGQHTVTWNRTSEIRSGVYFCTLRHGGQRRTARLVIN